MDVIASAVSSEIGKRLIPIPVLGPIIGNAVGMFVYKMTKNYISNRLKSLKRNGAALMNSQTDEC